MIINNPEKIEKAISIIIDVQLHTTMIATVRMLNGDVFHIEDPSNDHAIIQAVADEYNLSSSTIHLNYLGDDHYFGWMNLQDSYKVYVFWEEDDDVYLHEDLDVNPLVFRIMIYKTDVKECIFKVKVILNLTNGRIALADHCESERRYHPNKDRFTRYHIRSDTPWFNSLHECILTTYPELPEEILEMMYKIQHRLYMEYMCVSMELSSMVHSLLRRTTTTITINHP